jgi:hypothetical protein
LTLVGTGAAHAADAPTDDDLRAAAGNAWGSRGRLELGGAFALHDHTVTSGADRTSAQGSAVSHLRAGAAWMAERRPLGVAAALELERFALRPSVGATASSATSVVGLDASAGLLGRLGGPRARAALEGQLGYALARLPILEPPAAGGAPMTIRPVTLQGHGPAAAVRLTLRLAEALDVEATARVLPRLFGARAQGASIRLSRYAGGGGVRVGVLDAVGVNMSALVGYEAEVTDGAGALSVHQLQHRLGLGLRAAFPEAQAPRTIEATAPPAPVAAIARPLVRGVVRTAGDQAEPGQVLAEVSIQAPDGRRATTDAEGRFILEGLAPGLVQLQFSRDGFQELTEVVSVPEQGDAQLDIRLRAVVEARSAALIGQVRKGDDTPVQAQVRILELGLSARADGQGRFRFDLPPGRYTLMIESPGFVSQRKQAPVGAGEQNIFNVVLQRQR